MRYEQFCSGRSQESSSQQPENRDRRVAVAQRRLPIESRKSEVVKLEDNTAWLRSYGSIWLSVFDSLYLSLTHIQRFNSFRKGPIYFYNQV